MENSVLRNYFSDQSGVLLLASLMRASTLFSTIAGRSHLKICRMYDQKHAQSMSFLIIWGIHSSAMTSRKTYVEEIERFLVNFFRVQADYKRGECL